MINRTGLVPPYSGNSGDGNASEPELTTADEIKEMIEAPARDARVGAKRDAISYLIHNKMCDADSRINIRQAICVRWNIPWAQVDAAIAEAEPLADVEFKRREVAHAARQKKKIEFETLIAPLKALGLEVIEMDGYTVSGLNEEQLRFLTNALAAHEGA